MAESELSVLRNELNLTKLQLNSIYEFSSALQTSSSVEDIMRIYFSIMMGPLGVSRAFFFDRKREIFYKKGFFLSAAERKKIHVCVKIVAPFTCLHVRELPDEYSDCREQMQEKQIQYLINLSDNRRSPIILGLGYKFNTQELTLEDQEFIFFLSRFALIALKNVFFVRQLLEKKRIEYEISIASQIQKSLLPQNIPELKHFEIAVIYKPIREVGGDYYDLFIRKKNIYALVLADVEGKGLPAALLAASSQAIFHTMNELYLFHPAKFIHKANNLISEMTRGERFITLFWLILDDENRTITYVNAGHNPPFLIRGEKTMRLDKGGIFLGFQSAEFQQETIKLLEGDLIVAYTDGVFEVENPSGKEYGEKRIHDFIQSHRKLSARELADRLQRDILNFSKKEKFRDDFTILIIKSIQGAQSR